MSSSLGVEYDMRAVETLAKLKSPGCLLVSAKRGGERNVMTIGWGLVGVFWRMPVFVVAVRHSRFTHEFIEDTGEFTVNVPAEGQEKIVDYCGEVSGREHNKFKECKLTLAEGRNVRVPVVQECKIHYECKVIFKLEAKPGEIPDDVKEVFYRSGDYHTLYFGKILGFYSQPHSHASQKIE